MNRPIRGRERAADPGPLLVAGRITGRLAPDTLHAAVLAVAARHPALRSQRVGERWVTRDLDPERVRFQVRHAPPVLGDPRAPWERIAESELRWPLDADQGLVLRAVQVPEPGGSAVLLAAHPGLVDAVALGQILHEVLAAAAGIARPCAAVPAPPAAIDAVAPPAPLRWLARVVGGAARRGASSILPIEAHGPLRTACAFRRGAADAVERRAAAAAAAGVEPADVAAAALVFAIARQRAVDEPLRALVEIEVDLRPEAPVELAGAVAQYTGSLHVPLELDADTGFWALARTARRRRVLSAGWGLAALGAPADADPVGPPAIADLGGWAFPTDHGALRLTEVHHCATAAAPLRVWIRSLPGGTCYDAVSAAPHVSRATLDAVLDRVVAVCEDPPAAGATLRDAAAPDTARRVIRRR